MTAVDLARIQFAVTTNAHFLFVVVTLGLAPLIAFMQLRWVVTGREVHERMTRFWGQIYVVNYALGIVTGIVMEFQFGLNWTGVSRVAGQVFGAPLALETIIAFFAEATFLGLWIFGWGRIPKWLHFGLFLLVTATAYASAYWIMIANGFMQHPVGAALTGNGSARITDFAAMAANPNTVGALAHLIPAALMTGGVLVTAVSAYHLRRRVGRTHAERRAERPRDEVFFVRSMRIGMITMVVAALATFALGWAQLDYLRTDQPFKLVALGLTRDPMTLPAGGQAPPSWIATPFTIMATYGEVFSYIALFLPPFLIRRWIVRRRILLKFLVWMLPLPFVAVVCGWLVREVGRQPWVIYGVLRTSNAAAPLSTGAVAASLVVFTLLFAVLAATDWLLMARLARRGPYGMALGSTLDEAESGDAAIDPPAPAYARTI
ncbi:MAG TPA: cytochrome ubiquinol oxidase subunit I [Streptosporangiaceae bacterium]